MSTVCDYYKKRAIKAVEQWDGASNHDLIDMLEDALGEKLPPTIAANKKRQERQDVIDAAVRKIDNLQSEIMSFLSTLDELRDKIA